MRTDILLELSTLINSRNFIYNTFALVDGKDIFAADIAKNNLNVTKACLAYYIVTNYQAAIPNYSGPDDVFANAAAILEIDPITADFLFASGNNINFNFNSVKFRSDADECKAKIKHVINLWEQK
jgi:hypothetical protein